MFYKQFYECLFNQNDMIYRQISVPILCACAVNINMWLVPFVLRSENDQYNHGNIRNKLMTSVLMCNIYNLIVLIS